MADVAPEFRSAHAFQAGRPNQFERQSRLRHQLRFHPAFRSDNHDAFFPFPRPASVPAPQPFPRDGERRENVAARAAAGNQQILRVRRSASLRIRAHVSSACWLMFRSTPVANSITSRLDPP